MLDRKIRLRRMPIRHHFLRIYVYRIRRSKLLWLTKPVSLGNQIWLKLKSSMKSQSKLNSIETILFRQTLGFISIELNLERMPTIPCKGRMKSRELEFTAVWTAISGSCCCILRQYSVNDDTGCESNCSIDKFLQQNSVNDNFTQYLSNVRQ